MLTSAEDAYTSYVTRMCVEDDVDEDVVRATLRRLGHSTPSIRSILGEGGRERHHATVTSTDTSCSAGGTTATATADAFVCEKGHRQGTRAAAVARQSDQGHTDESQPHALRGASAGSVSLESGDSGFDDHITALHTLLETLTRELNGEGSEAAVMQAEAKVQQAARRISCGGRRSVGPASLPASSVSTPVTCATGPNELSSSRTLLSATPTSSTTPSEPVEVAHPTARQGPRRSCEYIFLEDLAAYEDALRRQQREREQRRANAAEARLAQRGFIPSAAARGSASRVYSPGSAAATRRRRVGADNTSPGDGLRGRPIRREPVGSAAVAAAPDAVDRRQRTSAAAPCVHSVSMRRAVSVASPSTPYHSTREAVGSTLPRWQQVDKVRQAQRYLTAWERQARAAEERKKRAVWVTRCRLLGVEE